MKKRLRLTPILIAIMMVFTMMPLISTPLAYAHDPIVVKSGIKYSLNESDKIASVVGYDSIPEGGAVAIPSSITTDGRSYRVVSIDKGFINVKV